MLVLLLMAVSGAWADTTVTWEGTTLQSIAVCKGYTNNVTTESMTVDGITITANKGYLLNDDQEGVELCSGAANGVVFSAENNIKSITITSTGFSQFTPDGDFEFDGGSHTYEVSPAATSYGFENDVLITGITKIEITLEGAPTVAVTGVTLAPTSATLTLGETETVTLTANVLPAEATDKSVTWSSSDEAVATVTDGVVTAVAAGTATITVTTTDGAKTATCAVTVAAPAASTYTVTLKEGTEDATSWTIAPPEATTTGVAQGTEVTATYGGTKKVKSVKAVKKAKPAATVTTAPTAKTGVKAGEDVAIVNEGTAEGGTMMYMVNATQPASTDGFSATVPTAEGLTAGTYYVWYYVKADDSHTDSEISATGIEVTIAAAYTMAAAATSADKGKLICTDGHIHANGADAACTKARVAKIIYIGTTGDATYNHGLALALNDEASTMAWQDAIDACSAKNTNTPVTGATWLLASYNQWNYMLGTNGAGGYDALRTAFTSVGGSDLQSDGYWSSTQSSDRQAYYFNFNKSDYYTALKTYAKWVRACLAF